METWRSTIVGIAVALMVVVTSGEEKAIDKEACREQRLGMATCLPYMKGQSRSPTPDCCSGLREILNSDKNCICVIIQDRNDPQLGLQNQINASLAFTLPSLCHATANVSKCPALLHLDPNSPEAQVFYYIDAAINKISPASAPTGSEPEPSTSPTPGSDDANNSGKSSTSLLRLQVVAHFFLLLCICNLL